MALKLEHKNRLKHLALDSVINVALKEVLKYYICEKTFLLDDRRILITSTNANKALAELFTDGKEHVKKLFVTAYPEIQNLVYKDKKLEIIRDEININALDNTALCAILLKFPILPTWEGKDNEEVIQSILKDIFHQRLITAHNSLDCFWTGLSDGKIKLGKNLSVKTWDEHWTKSKTSVMELLKFLKEEEELAENQYKLLCHEIKLINTWTKQELIQNYQTQITSQLKSLQYLNKEERPFSETKSEEVTIRVADITSQTHLENDKWLIGSIFSSLKFLLWPSKQRYESSAKYYGMDGTIAVKVENAFRNIVKDVFNENSWFVFTQLTDITLNPGTSSDENMLIPLTIRIFQTKDSSRMLFMDPKSDSACSLWLTMHEEISNSVEENLGICVDVIRTRWNHSGRINVCIFRKDKLPWSPQECTDVTHTLQSTKYSIEMYVFANPMAVEEHALFRFQISTSNHHLFDLVHLFADVINHHSEEKSIHIDRRDLKLEDLIYIHDLDKLKMIGERIFEKVQATKSTTASSTKESDTEKHQLLVINESNQTGIPKRKTSTSSISSTPRSTGGITPRSTPTSTPRRPSISREGSFTITKETSPREDVSNSGKHLVTRKKSQESLTATKATSPTEETKPNSMEVKRRYSRDVTKQLSPREDDFESAKTGIPKTTRKPNEGRKSIGTNSESFPDKGRLKFMLALEFVVKPALLSILHNEKDDPEIQGLPRDEAELYTAMLELEKKIPPQKFEKLHKSEKRLMFPQNGRTISALFDLDTIGFLLCEADVVHRKKLSYCKMACGLKSEAAGMDLQSEKTLSWMMKRIEEVVKKLNYDSKLITKIKTNDWPWLI